MSEATEEDKDAEFKRQQELSRAVAKYVRAEADRNAASREYNAATKDLRDKLGVDKEVKFIMKIDYKHYLVSKYAGDEEFDVELVDLLY